MICSMTTGRYGLLLLASASLASRSLAAEKAPAIDFGRDIRPIFSENCYACHGPDKDKRKAGLRLDLKEDAFKKLDSGDFAIVPGKPDQSRLLKVISLPPGDDDHMPPAKTGKKLTPAQVELLRRWIVQGAKWAGHWAYVAPERPPVPEVRNKKWPRNDIDRFILAALEQKRLKPNPDADRYTLIRRVSLDLTGLPPTIQEVDDFVADRSPNAYEKLVERLLASPHFGERLALAWLDQARYADTAGYHFDGFRQMHLWRDWVIKAFNDNKPFDQFTIEQLAGDLLPDATIHQKIASGFHRNVMTNDEGGADPDEYLAKYVVDRVSTTAQVWLGTTLGCAECHDHKYDPISTREFYQLYAFFHSVPEKGLDGTRVRNPAPVLKVPSPDQGSRLIRFLELIPAAEKTLAEREAELPKAQETWEKELQKLELKAPELAGLVKALPFDEADVTTNRAPGKIGRALHLRGGTNDFVDLGRAVSFENTDSFSYSAWIKLHGRTGAVLSKMEEGPGYRGFDLLINDAKAEVHLVNKFPDNAIKVVTKDALPTNLWLHLLVTYDGSNKAGGLRIFVDGKSRPLDTPTDKLSATILTEAPLLIGARIKAFPFAGLIDDVRFYQRRLRSEEAASLASYGNLLITQTAADQRTDEQKTALKKYFRENAATAFIAAEDRLAKLRKDKDDLMAQIPDTMVMDELEKPRETFILARGNFQSKGEKVNAGTPACWPPLPTDQPANRLSLARWLVSTNHPLTARVTANRYWAMLFGTGLVKTSNDFGSQGERPSHPELLDWLACEFKAPTPSPGAAGEASAGNKSISGWGEGGQKTPRSAGPWDIKHLLRLLVTSATYRQSAVVTGEKLERDPYNRLLTRGPRVRLDAELIRDNALAISGLLNAKIGGPSVKPYQPPGIWDGTDHKYEQSHGADLYRRGMYVFWKRAAHYPSFQTFDAPSRETCTLQRPRTSTPLQSLVVMNDPVYVEAARAFATRVLQQRGLSLKEQLTLAFRLALARPPEKKELAILEKTYREQKANFAQDKKAADELLAVGESPRPRDIGVVELAAMTGVANVLLNLNETITR
jgi:mono/diheme cytochrome c family protein